MHMADALISPAVGGTMWAVSAGTIAYCSKKVRQEFDDKKVPLMGVLGAFIFAAQMINFTIPVTGSSGHLGGGLILAILLGPYAAFLTIASVLVVQALFFADGGLLALGCNIFNIGFFPAFIAYPFIYKKIIGNNPTQRKMVVAAIVSATVGLQLGALGVVLQTTFSAISSLPFSTFIILMQPIHLGIGIIEGLVTAIVVSFVLNARPEIILGSKTSEIAQGMTMRKVIIAFVAVAFLSGGVLSWFASENPDGLEWSIEKITGNAEIEREVGCVHKTLAGMQEKLAFLPDYSIKKTEAAKSAETTGSKAVTETIDEKKEKMDKIGTSVSGIIGGLITLGVAFFIGFVLKRKKQLLEEYSPKL